MIVSVTSRISSYMGIVSVKLFIDRIFLYRICRYEPKSYNYQIRAQLFLSVDSVDSRWDGEYKLEIFFRKWFRWCRHYNDIWKWHFTRLDRTANGQIEVNVKRQSICMHTFDTTRLYLNTICSIFSHPTKKNKQDSKYQASWWFGEARSLYFHLA